MSELTLPARVLRGLKPILILATVTACSAAGSSVPSSPVAQPAVMMPATGNPVSKHIKHVIVIIQENRTIENLFAGYPNADAPTYGYGLDDSGKRYKIPLHPVTFDGPDLSHLWEAAMIDWRHGKMDGFSAFGQNGNLPAYAYVEHSLIQPYWSMAQQYVLADHMFPTEFGPSWTAHINLVAGTDSLSQRLALADFSDGPYNSCDSPPGTRTTVVNVRRVVSHAAGPFPCLTEFNTMAEVLDNAGVSWKYYATKLRHAGIWEPFEAIKYVRRGPDWRRNIAVPQTLILTDPKNGQLASVSWVTPSKADSDNPGAHSSSGPSWVAQVVNAVGKSSYWDSSAIIVVWDDWGGWYDNAPPPQLDYRGLGIRVSCLIISPYARHGYVSHTQYEFGSILKFMEQAFNLPPIGPTDEGYTDTRATSIVDSFDFQQKPRAFQPIKATYGPEHFLAEPPSDDPVDSE